MLIDEEIIELFFRRSENAISETIKKYGKLCEKIIDNILGNKSDTEECMNDISMSLWNSIPPHNPENLKGYISRTARNTAINRYRMQKRKKRDFSTVLNEAYDFLSDNSFENETESKEISSYINEFLESSEKESRIIFVLRYYYGESIESIADKMNLKNSNVKTKLHRMRKKLAAYLNERGINV